jgi:hypothetical protein
MKPIIIILFFSTLLLSQTTTNYFKYKTTGINATIAITTLSNPNVNGIPLDVGDEIGVFNSTGLCCGAVVWQKANTAIIAYGDDVMTTNVVEGFKEGELINYKIWVKKSNKVYNAKVQYNASEPYKTGFFYSNGIYYLIDITGYTSSTNIYKNIIPEKFFVYPNYPNPFNPSTNIKIKIPQKSHLTIDVYDINGNQVNRINDSFLPPGEYIFKWDGRDKNMNLVPSGIYFYKVKVNENIQIGKMLLAR